MNLGRSQHGDDSGPGIRRERFEAVRSKPIPFIGPMVRALLENRKTQTRRLIKPDHTVIAGMPVRTWGIRPCHFASPGDHMWVQETWAHQTIRNGSVIASRVIYEADGYGDLPIKWRRSSHLPKKYSRITIEAISVRPERLNEISEDDARSEGVDITDSVTGPMVGTYRGAFCRLWETIYGPGSWDSNPWVWRIEFKKVA